ncbi:MAG TPA: histidine phosphatase family protein [Candidatus Lachnoclostridium stercoravium]|uniref:Histidine phosphatase family protein n=1 Tax=Candidatus Lachnoclostridium stercoravium TaxID=2838633 RepID=A0A9D2HJM1_9FIRM|nr:histidine phosphatase family protein [Candidatus Lachnoclostridium stercoravium]
MKIYLIRHGQTDWNLEGKIQGRHDVSLNETGSKQAELLAMGMDKRPVVQIFSSRQKRALETAQAVGRRQHVAVTVIDGLEEVEFGEWEGKTWDEISREYPEEFKVWCTEPAEIVPPGGESRPQIYRRIGNALKEILRRSRGDIAIVSHGAALAYMVSIMLEKELGDHDEIIVKNASISTVEYDRETGKFHMAEANDVSHLKALSQEQGSVRF